MVKRSPKCHLGVLQRGQKVIWQNSRGNFSGRIADFTRFRGVAAAVVDLLPYRSRRRRVTIPLERLEKVALA